MVVMPAQLTHEICVLLRPPLPTTFDFGLNGVYADDGGDEPNFNCHETKLIRQPLLHQHWYPYADQECLFLVVDARGAGV